MRVKILPYCISLILLNACSSAPEIKRKTLADMEFNEPDKISTDAPRQIEKPDLGAQYKAILAMQPEPQTRVAIESRLAQLQLEREQLAQEKGLEQQEQGYYSESITRYNALLAQITEPEQRSELLYDLSKAYQLQGEAQKSFASAEQLLDEAPDFKYADELLFRQGEYLYGQKRYSDAGVKYTQLVNQHPDSKLIDSARYMLAWSEFKRSNYEPSLIQFTTLLESIFNTVEGAELSSLTKAQRYLVTDTLRIMSVIFSYNDSYKGITAHYQTVGDTKFSYLNYQSLGEFYIEKKRFLDAADSYGEWVATRPASSYAVPFALKQIEIYKKAAFRSHMRQAQQAFIANFGVTGPYWYEKTGNELGGDYFTALITFEKKYADEAYYEAQKSVQNSAKLAGFNRAAAGFSAYLKTLSARSQQDLATHYLMAESLLQGQSYQAALNEYEYIAYEADANPFQANAAYAIVSIYNTLIKQKPVANELVAKAIGAWQRFADTFTQDERTIAVRENIIAKLFETKQYDSVLSEADKLLSEPRITQALAWQTQVTKAHALFNLARYAEAEAAYLALWQPLDDKHPDKAQLATNLSASIVKQAEHFALQTDLVAAADKFLSLVLLMPSSELRKSVQYQAIQYLFQSNEFEKVTPWLEDYQTRYPKSSEIDLVRKQLASVYQNSGDNLKIAEQYEQVAKLDGDIETQRKAYLISAEHYLKAEQLDKARLLYRYYAHNYAQPFAQNFEAQYQLSEIYKVQNKSNEQRFWLNKLIKAERKAPADYKTRAKQVAAEATLVFAKDASYLYQKAKLTLPLKKSLAKKRKLMEQTLSLFEQLNDYGIAEFSTLATYEMARVYQQLAKDIMNSDRPKLDELALEQYDILLEEQAIPFEDKAIQIFQVNVKRSWQGVYDEHVKQSFSALATMMPARFGKKEQAPEVNNAIF